MVKKANVGAVETLDPVFEAAKLVGEQGIDLSVAVRRVPLQKLGSRRA